MQKPSTQIKLRPSPKSVLTTAAKPETAKPEKKEKEPIPTSEIHSKKTSPTLVEFQNKNSQVPEWRLQLKNAVQKRFGQAEMESSAGLAVQTAPSVSEAQFPTSGGNAFKAEVIEEIRPQNVDNQKLANALKRIEQSRQKFYIVEPEEIVEVVREIDPPFEEKTPKEFPFTIAARNENPAPVVTDAQLESAEAIQKPQLVPNQETETPKDFYDTSELDPEFPPAKVSTSFERTFERTVETKPPVKVEKPETKIEVETEPETKQDLEETKTEVAFVDEIAPFALRFNAGLFDVLVGSFSSLVLLAPFMLMGGDWFSIAGFFAFLTTSAIVMFIYLTTTVGLFGKTFGMHLFSLEMVDYFDDEYPTFHQAAVSSSIYLLSLALGGAGFATMLFDEDKRAIHDMISGTLIVKEL